jgi:ubiquinone biosynthesis monooxygenase Coq7
MSRLSTFHCCRISFIRCSVRSVSSNSNSNSNSNCREVIAATTPITHNSSFEVCTEKHIVIQAFLSKSASHPHAARAVSDLRSDHAGEWGAVKIYEGAEIAAQWRLSHDPDASGLLRLIDFVHRHRESESRHLALMTHILPPQHRSRLLPLWSAAGFLLGAVQRASSCAVCFNSHLTSTAQIPMLFGGPAAVYRTVVHVETFVERHYSEQIDWMVEHAAAEEHSPDAAAIREIVRVLSHCCSDEVHHLNEADAACPLPPCTSSATLLQRVQVSATMMFSAAGAFSHALHALLDRAWQVIVARGSAAAVRACRVF